VWEKLYKRKPLELEKARTVDEKKNKFERKMNKK
jgi:hypothetical protein